MGFSLKLFFDDLEHILNTSSIFTVYGKLRKLVEETKKYAQETGALK